MPGEQKPIDQFEGSGDATHDGGASADRGGRDTAMPGPDPGSGTTGGKRRADSEGNGAHQTGSTGDAPDEAGSDKGSAPRPGV